MIIAGWTASSKRGALIGCGYISERQLRAWQQIETAEIVAMCDLDAEKAGHRAHEFGIPAVYTDYRRLLDEVALDFVDITTCPTAHLELVTAAAGRELHVLCPEAAGGFAGRSVPDGRCVLDGWG